MTRILCCRKTNLIPVFLPLFASFPFGITGVFCETLFLDIETSIFSLSPSSLSFFNLFRLLILLLSSDSVSLKERSNDLDWFLIPAITKFHMSVLFMFWRSWLAPLMIGPVRLRPFRVRFLCLCNVRLQTVISSALKVGLAHHMLLTRHSIDMVQFLEPSDSFLNSCLQFTIIDRSFWNSLGTYKGHGKCFTIKVLLASM